MAKTWRRLPAKTRLRRVDEQATCITHRQCSVLNHSSLVILIATVKSFHKSSPIDQIALHQPQMTLQGHEVRKRTLDVMVAWNQ
jgi:hypothetical protein